MCRIGNGYNGMKRFLVLMKHPPPMTGKKYRKLSTVFQHSVKHNVVDTGVSVDGTWQKRGITYLNGAVAAISIETCRVLDVEVMTRYCQGCINIANFRENREMYEHLKKDHECISNHEGSAGKMEVTGVERIFPRSIETQTLLHGLLWGWGFQKY